MVAFSQKAMLALFILCTTSVLYFPVCSTVVPRNVYPLPCARRPFIFISHGFAGVFATITFFVFMAFNSISYCSQVAFSLLIVR